MLCPVSFSFPFLPSFPHRFECSLGIFFSFVRPPSPISPHTKREEEDWRGGTSSIYIYIASSRRRRRKEEELGAGGARGGDVLSHIDTSYSRESCRRWKKNTRRYRTNPLVHLAVNQTHRCNDCVHPTCEHHNALALIVMGLWVDLWPRKGSETSAVSFLVLLPELSISCDVTLTPPLSYSGLSNSVSTVICR